MSIFNPKQQTEAKARSKRAWPFRLLPLMTILMGMLLGSPQLSVAQEPNKDSDGSIAIQELKDGTKIAAGLISVVVKSDLNFKLPELGYEWVELQRTPLFGGQSEAILYEINPSPQSLEEYRLIIAWLQNNNLPIECADMNPILGSPNTWADGGGEPNVLKNSHPKIFRQQWAFPHIRLKRPKPLRKYKGQEVTVAVLDAFQDNVEALWSPAATNYINVYDVLPVLDVDDPDALDLSKHGDMVMSLAQHVAPKIELWPVRVLNQSGMGYTFTVIEGLNQVLQQHHKEPERRLVVNMSLGMDLLEDEGCGTKIIKNLLNQAEAQGIVVVAAAGNETQSYPEFPASEATVIGVEASKRKPFAKLASYSNKVVANQDVRAPGGDCAPKTNCKLRRKHAIIGRIPTPTGKENLLWTGTSFAAPLTSGLAADLLSCKHFTPSEVRDFISESTTSNSGLISVRDALDKAGCN